MILACFSSKLGVCCVPLLAGLPPLTLPPLLAALLPTDPFSLPSPRARSCVAPCSASKFYLNNRGRTEYALDAVLARVEEEHEGQGDGSFVQVVGYCCPD